MELLMLDDLKSFFSVLLCLFISGETFAQKSAHWDNPTKPFDANTKRVHDGSISIEWRLAKGDIGKACDAASREFGNNGFMGETMQACAFHWGYKCVIITKEKPTMHTVGHEIRHCFYGVWH